MPLFPDVNVDVTLREAAIIKSIVHRSPVRELTF